MTTTDRVLIALTRQPALPRTAYNISVETGVPAPTVRRILGELRKSGSRFVRASR